MVVRLPKLEAEAKPAAVTEQPELVSGEPAAAEESEASEIRISTWSFSEPITIAPHVWDTDTPQVGEGAIGSDPDADIMIFAKEEDVVVVPTVPEPPRKSLKEKQKKMKKKSAAREFEGSFIIWLTPGSAPAMEAPDQERRPRSMAEMLMATNIHSTEDNAVLAVETAGVQVEVTKGPIATTIEVQPPIEGDELVVKMVGELAIGAFEVAPPIAPLLAGTGQKDAQMVVEINYPPLVDGNQVETVPVSPILSAASMAATVVTANGVDARKRRS